jgi:hypothetical protein
MESTTERKTDDLSANIGRVAKALEDQNKLTTRLFAGVMFGVGTAIGASVIATLIIITVAKLLAPIGIDFISEIKDTRALLDSQVQSGSSE